MKIAFTGDFAFSQYFKEAYKDDKLFSQEIIDFLNDADETVVNVEGPITSGPLESTRLLNHFTHPDGVNWLNRLGATVWSLGNNHVVDCGRLGVQDTLELAAKHGVKTVGAGMNRSEAAKPLPLSPLVGLVSVVYNKDVLLATDTEPGCVFADDYDMVRAEIGEIKKQCRYCIVVAHVGCEFSRMPMRYVREMYLKFLEMGADAVVGHHPHVVQNYEIFDGKPILYSLGNFVFDTNYQRMHRFTEDGVLVKLNVPENGGSITFEAMGTHIDRGTHRISASKPVAIFTEINADEYEKLVPYSIAEYETELFDVIRYSHEKAHDTPFLPTTEEWDEKIRDRASQKLGGADEIICNRGVVLRDAWKEADRPDVIDFINACR